MPSHLFAFKNTILSVQHPKTVGDCKVNLANMPEKILFLDLNLILQTTIGIVYKLH